MDRALDEEFISEGAVFSGCRRAARFAPALPGVPAADGLGSSPVGRFDSGWGLSPRWHSVIGGKFRWDVSS